MQVGCDIIIEDTASAMTANVQIRGNIMHGSNDRIATKNFLCVLALVKPTQLGAKKGILAVFRCHKGESLGVLSRSVDPVFMEIQGLTGKERNRKHR